ncbi:uncharacterized protein LOC142775976 isoform X1 [Rhipicephalus microplus]|uniref:uncharacterized protein LOC142775976 isoform X1 n=1 Tax=Rhipicephalus microplus TaxID=6941 RepID=UPI003F6BCC43
MSFFFLTGHSLSSLVGTWQAGVLPLVSEVSERECACCSLTGVCQAVVELLLCPGLSCQGHIVRGTSSADFSDGPGPLDGPHLVFKGLAEKGGLPSLSKTPHVAM